MASALLVIRIAMVDVDCIEGCAVQMETVLRCTARHSQFVRGQGGLLYSQITDGRKMVTHLSASYATVSFFPGHCRGLVLSAPAALLL